ncbi:MAG TPA: hypothetical protein VLY85_00105 [Thermoplasmata archaeon]|nr:hypothetical protein [Thermoplasmata archaeon]
MPLFKTGDQLFSQGRDLVLRKEFEPASVKFLDAARKLEKSGDLPAASLAEIYAQLVRLRPGAVSPQAVAVVVGRLRQVGPVPIHVGARPIGSIELAGQLGLMARELQLDLDAASGRIDLATRAKELQQLASDYRTLGDAVLFLPELFLQRTQRASEKVPVLAALSEEALGEAYQRTDPLTAAEHFQAAQNWWRQAGNEARALASAERVNQLSFRARCWFCGREGSGQGIQFVSLPIDQSVHGLQGIESSPLPSIDGTGRYVYACKGCFSAFRLLADQVAIFRASEVERRLMVQIQNLQARLQGRLGA